jgi:hypothetical protein
MVALALTGCGFGGEKTVTVDRTVTVEAESGTSPEAKQAYIDQVSERTSQADVMNRDFRSLIERYNRGELKAEEMANKADQNWRAYEDLGRSLTEMRIPQEFQSAHNKLISGFSKWRSAYEANRDGFRDNNPALLEKANDLDNQASIEVNQAVSEISQQL